MTPTRDDVRVARILIGINPLALVVFRNSSKHHFTCLAVAPTDGETQGLFRQIRPRETYPRLLLLAADIRPIRANAVRRDFVALDRFALLGGHHAFLERGQRLYFFFSVA